MTQTLLIVAWPYEDQVLTSFRYADGYSMPAEYTGEATLTQIRSKVDDDGYEVLYRCQGCFSWDQNGVASSVSTSQGYIVAGQAQGNVVPENPGCPSDITFAFHDDGFGQSGLPLDDAPSESYEEWAALASNTVTGTCGGDAEEPPAEDDTPAPTDDGEAEPTDAPEEEPETPEETSGEGESQPAPSQGSGQSDFGSSQPSWLVDDDDEPEWWEQYVSDEEDEPEWWEQYVDDEEDEPEWWEQYVDDDEDEPEWWEQYVDEDGEDQGQENDSEPTPTLEEDVEETSPTGGVNTRPTREPRPTVTFGPGPDEPSEGTDEPSETGSPSEGENTRPTRPPRPTPTFWPDPWEPNEPSETSEVEEPTEEPTGEPEETSEVEEPTEEPSDEPSEPSDVEEPTEEPTDEPEETSDVDEPTEEPTDEPEETAVPSDSQTPAVSFIMPDPSQTSDSESPVETEVPEESVTEEPEPSETGTEVPEESEPVETETDSPEEETPVETATDEPEEPVETETPDEPEEVTCNAVGEDETFDYVVIGAGAGGIPVAERLTAAGHKVLLLEKGPPSTDRWGGDMKPEWLEGEDLTRFDVPGLCNQIWHDSTGIVCTDMDQIAGCVLGGGTAVNAGLWWKVSLSSPLVSCRHNR